MVSGSSLLVPSVSDDEIAAELAAGLPPEEAAELQAARLRLAAPAEPLRDLVAILVARDRNEPEKGG